MLASLGKEGYTTKIIAGTHPIIADEPIDIGGADIGPTTYQLLGSALAACTSMTLRMYADIKKWDLQKVEVEVERSKVHAEDWADCEDKNAKVDRFERRITVTGGLDKKQKERLLYIANRCPVHRTLQSDIIIATELD